MGCCISSFEVELFQDKPRGILGVRCSWGSLESAQAAWMEHQGPMVSLGDEWL